MTLYLLTANRTAIVATDDPIVSANDVGPLRTALDVVTRAQALYDGAAREISGATEHAAVEGRTFGIAQGKAAAEAETREHLLDIAARAAIDRADARADVSRLSLEIVRRIAGEIGEPGFVAALAERATADLLPDAVATVRVSPSARAVVHDRLRTRAGLTVIGDPALSLNDCIIETALGLSRAGLETQLDAIERAWAGTAETSDAG